MRTVIYLVAALLLAATTRAFEVAQDATNLTFSANSAINGGGMFNQGSRPTLTNVTFRANNAKFGEGYTTSVAATQTCATVSCGATRP